MAAFACASGELVGLAGGRRASGATHGLRDKGGRWVMLLRSRSVSLDLYEGRRVRVRGYRCGQVLGEEAPVMEVHDLVPLDRVPFRPGLDHTALGGCVLCPEVPVRPFLG
ncbi:MAG: hypothetical protein DIU70_005765 [Bacillota bacterium]|nr:MAG: hypothetical protein DIU70_11965 [Bacillota bacterium]